MHLKLKLPEQFPMKKTNKSVTNDFINILLSKGSLTHATVYSLSIHVLNNFLLLTKKE